MLSGIQLRCDRKELGASQGEVAQLSGIPRARISEAELGSLITLEEEQKLIAALGEIRRSRARALIAPVVTREFIGGNVLDNALTKLSDERETQRELLGKIPQREQRKRLAREALSETENVNGELAADLRRRATAVLLEAEAEGAGDARRIEASKRRESAALAIVSAHGDCQAKQNRLGALLTALGGTSLL